MSSLPKRSAGWSVCSEGPWVMPSLLYTRGYTRVGMNFFNGAVSGGGSQLLHYNLRKNLRRKTWSVFAG
jgi:hypothetical protein